MGEPQNVRAMLIFDRIKQLAPQHPQWQNQEPFASVLWGDVKAPLAGSSPALLEMAMATHAGVTTEDFERIVSSISGGSTKDSMKPRLTAGRSWT